METKHEIPSNFRSLVNDFANDLTVTFPEHEHLWKRWNNKEVSEPELSILFTYCTKIYPQRFFDILYQNEHWTAYKMYIEHIKLIMALL